MICIDLLIRNDLIDLYPGSARFYDFSAEIAERSLIIAESARFQISSAISAEERPLSFGNAECRNGIFVNSKQRN